MAISAHPHELGTAAEPAFADILCAVDGSRGSAAGVRQAIALAQPGGHLSFVSVTDVRGVGANRMGGLGEHRAAIALAGSKALARGCDVPCDAELIHDRTPVDAILARQPMHDLLVVGSHRVTRAGGIMTGSVATYLAHRTTGPLLVARETVASQPFPRRIVVGTEARSAEDPVVAAALRLARVHDARIHVVHSGGDRGALSELTADIGLATGYEPLVTAQPGNAADLIVKVARSGNANLVVVGHGGRQRIAALGSVSERVVHSAPCSVLVVPTV